MKRALLVLLALSGVARGQPITGGGMQKVIHDSTLSGNGTNPSPLSALSIPNGLTGTLTSGDLIVATGLHTTGNYPGSDPGACTSGQADTHPALSATGALTKSCAVFVNAAGTGLSLSGSTLSLPNVGPGALSYTLTNLTLDAQGRVTAASSYGGATAPADKAITALSAAGAGTFAYFYDSPGTGLATGATGNIVKLADTAVGAGSYTYSSLTVDAQGRLTAASSGATPALATTTITAGNGLTGGGDLSANRTIDVGAGNGISVAADSVAVNNGSGLVFSLGALTYDSAVIQSRVAPTCAAPNAIRAIASDGTVTCTSGTGSVTSIATTAPISGGTITSTGTISLVESSNFRTNAGALDLATAVVMPGTLDATAGVLSIGAFTTVELSPASFSTTQNDYNPASLSGATVLRLNCTNASGCTVSGIAGGASGRRLRIYNVGANKIILSNQDAGSTTAGDRFKVSDGANFTVQPNSYADPSYDGTLSRWVVEQAISAGSYGQNLAVVGTLTADSALRVFDVAGTGLTSSANTVSMPNTGPGVGSYTYSSITLDAQGRVTAASSGAAPVTSGGTLTNTDLVVATGGSTVGNYGGSTPSACAGGSFTTGPSLSVAGVVGNACVATGLTGLTTNRLTKNLSATTIGDGAFSDDGTTFGKASIWTVVEASGNEKTFGTFEAVSTTTLDAALNMSSGQVATLGKVIVLGANTNTAPTNLAAVELFTGRTNAGVFSAGQTVGDLAFNYGGPSGGYRHWISTKHGTGADTNDAIRFYVNNSATAGGSSAPGTGNTQVLDLYGNQSAKFYSALSVNGALNMNTNLINNVTDPVSNQDAATKNSTTTAVNAAVSGTTNTISKFTSANVIGNSSVTDDGTTVATNEYAFVAKTQGKALNVGMVDASNSVANTSNALSVLPYTDGNNYIDSKTYTAGTTIFRLGAGTENGATRTYETVTNSSGAVTWAAAQTLSSTLAVTGVTTLSNNETITRDDAGSHANRPVVAITNSKTTGALDHRAELDFNVYDSGNVSRQGAFLQAGATMQITEPTELDVLIGSTVYFDVTSAAVATANGATLTSAGALTASSTAHIVGALTVDGSATIGDAAADGLVVNASLTRFNATGDDPYVNANTLNASYSTNATSTLYLNYYGYQGGSTQFRDTWVADGKNQRVAIFTGSTKGTEFFGAITADTTLTTLAGNNVLNSTSGTTTVTGHGAAAGNLVESDATTGLTANTVGTAINFTGTIHEGTGAGTAPCTTGFRCVKALSVTNTGDVATVSEGNDVAFIAGFFDSSPAHDSAWAIYADRGGVKLNATSGTTTIHGALTEDSTSTLTGTVTMTGAATVGTTLGVTGTLSGADATFSTTLAVTGATTLSGATTVKNDFFVATTGGTNKLKVLAATGHVNVLGTAITTGDLSACGTTPAVATGSTDVAGHITEGTTATGCTLTFKNTYTNIPFCVCTGETSGVAAVLVGCHATATTLVLENASASSDTYTYVCIGQSGGT